MSRSEWLTIVVLLGAILLMQIITSVYQHFIWRDVCAMWHILWRQAFDEDVQKLHVGNDENREHRQGPGGVLGERRTSLSENLRDASPRSPFVY